MPVADVCVDLYERVFAHNNTRCAYTERCVNQLERDGTLLTAHNSNGRTFWYDVCGGVENRFIVEF